MVRNDKLTGLYMWDFQMWLSHYKPWVTNSIKKKYFW
jgi:hypothetical protein